MVNGVIPGSLTEVLDIMEREKTCIISGGSDFMVKNKIRKDSVDISQKPVFIFNLKELKHILIEGNRLIIGSCVTYDELLETTLIPSYIKEVLSEMASPAIRNSATIGGNICNSSPVGDSLPLLYALEAKLLIVNSKSEKKVNIEDFIKGPGKNILEPNELLKEIEIQLKPFDKIFYKKVGTRNSIALSKLSFMGMAKLNESGEVEDIRLAFGAVAPVIVKSKSLEEKIVSLKKLNNESTEEILSGYGNLIKPITDQRSDENYRKEISLRLLKKFLWELKD